MRRTAKKCVKKAPSMVVARDDGASLSAYFAEQDQLLLPMLELIDSGKQTIASVMNEAGRAIAELLLELSAQQIAGAKHPGRHAGEVRWHGSQDGQICLLERKLKVKRPRLRRRARGAIPLYERLRDDSNLSRCMNEILVNGVSTRKYRRAKSRKRRDGAHAGQVVALRASVRTILPMARFR